MIPEISAGYTALTTAYEIAKGLKNIDDQVKLNAAVIELQRQILSAQEATSSSRDRIRDLEAQVAAFENWEKTAHRYELKDFGGFTYAYELKPGAALHEPYHRLCPKCFEQRIRSILQFRLTDAWKRQHFKCFGCGSDYAFGHGTEPTHGRRDTGWVV